MTTFDPNNKDHRAFASNRPQELKEDYEKEFDNVFGLNGLYGFRESYFPNSGKYDAVPDVKDFIRTLANQKLKEGMEMALQCRPDEAPHEECYRDRCHVCSSPEGYNAGVLDFFTAIKKEIDKLTE